MGLSLVAPDQEVVYARVAGIRARATSSAVRRTLELQLRSIQVRHPAPASNPICLLFSAPAKPDDSVP